MIVEGERPRLLIVAGPNGSGKTTVTERGLAHEWFGGCEYINPDTIARDEFGDWNSDSAVRKAAAVAQERRERRSLAFETVFSGVDKVEFLRASQREGFFVRLFFVGTEDPTINASRVARRVMEGGHARSAADRADVRRASRHPATATAITRRGAWVQG